MKHKLNQIDPTDTGDFRDEEEAHAFLEQDLKRLYKLHYRMFAEGRRGLLIIFQGIDASGKDGAIRHICSGMNPQGVNIHSFKNPTELELRQDYLHRIHGAVPGRGYIGIFNRSHYEEVTTVMVHPELLEKQMLPLRVEQDRRIFEKRYRQINDFERMLTENGITILKFLLHISKDEQKKRLQERISDPERKWKFSKADIAERKHWNDYMRAFQKMLDHTDTDHAPWHVIPADKKWYRNFRVTRTLLSTLESMKLQFPRPKLDHIRIK